MLQEIYSSKYYGTSAYVDSNEIRGFRMVWQGVPRPRRPFSSPSWFGWMLACPENHEAKFIYCPKWWT